MIIKKDKFLERVDEILECITKEETIIIGGYLNKHIDYKGMSY